MSEGLLYYLAFAALGHLEQTAMLLIEEPENGLHPARIADVMRSLREVSKKTQVVIATHSPLVINELEGDEVSVVTRSVEHGTQVRLLKDTKDFEERSKTYWLGELWLSYADGNEESALLNGGPRP
jgi:predicted ATPase